MLSSAASEASKNYYAWPYVFSTRRISNPSVVQKIKVGSLCPKKLQSPCVMCELDSSSFKMSLDPSSETSTEIDFVGYGITIPLPGGFQRPTGESDVFKNEVEYVYDLFSRSNPSHETTMDSCSCDQISALLKCPSI